MTDSFHRPQDHREAAVWHLEQACSPTVLGRNDHFAAAQIEALLTIAEALRSLYAAGAGH
jgi:hypothetical protein